MAVLQVYRAEELACQCMHKEMQTDPKDGSGAPWEGA